MMPAPSTDTATLAAAAAAVASAAATVGLLIYAGVQTAIQKRAEETRARERAADEKERWAQRAADEDRAVDLALAVVNAEWFRLWSIASQLQSRDPIALASEGSLNPDDLQPADWANLTSNLAHLGFESATLAGYALSKARDASVEARRLLVAARKNTHAAETLDIAKRLRENSTEGALLLEDAISYCPRARVQRAVRTDVALQSKTGKRILEELKRRSQPGVLRALNDPPPADQSA